MLFWLFVVAAAVAAAIWIARPYLSRGSLEMNDAEGAISVFRDQQDEVDRDLADGLISADEAAAARQEIERRALKAARDLDGGLTMSRRSVPVAAALAGGTATIALALYAALGVPAAQDQPLAARKTEVLERRAAAGDINSRIALLIDRTAENPDSFEDWWTLGASYTAIGDHASAVDALRRAAELGGDRPAVLSAYAEAMVLANGNKVPTAARVIFEQVLRGGPDARARYYLALSKAQAQDFQGAIDDWAALARDSAPDAPWMPLVRRDIVNMARFLKADVATYLPDATPAEIARAGGKEQAGADGPARIAELEAALKADPMQYRTWIDLARLRAAAGDDIGAAAAIGAARDHYAAAPFVLQKLDQAAQALGLDLLPPSPGVSGPTDADIAAAADLTDAERGDMVEGMVAGLAAKLEENPDNPEGWIMLVRSYAVLGKPAKARESYDRAVAHFQGDAVVLARLQAEAGTMVPGE